MGNGVGQLMMRRRPKAMHAHASRTCHAGTQQERCKREIHKHHLAADFAAAGYPTVRPPLPGRAALHMQVPEAPARTQHGAPGTRPYPTMLFKEKLSFL